MGYAVQSSLSKIKQFLWQPTSPLPLGILRIALSVALFCQALWFSDSIIPMYSRSGLMQEGLTDYLSGLSVPNLGWVQMTLLKLGVPFSTTVTLAFNLYLLSLVLLAVGFKVRFTTVFAWFIHYLVVVSGYYFAYGVDHFANIFMFYFIFMPVGDSISWDSWREGTFWGKPSSGANLALRVLQFQLVVVYVSSGIYKSLGAQWWNGEAIWRSVTLPFPRLVQMGWLSAYPWIATVAGWATVILEIGYGIFMWIPQTRWLWILGIVLMHLGIAFNLGLFSFGIVMCILTLCVFGGADQPVCMGAKRELQACG